jgi:hypothetical protein
VKAQLIHLLAVSLLAIAGASSLAGPEPVNPTTAPQTRPAAADISIAAVTEDGEKLLRATVRSGGAPVENAVVRFSVRRTFGNLNVGEDKTLDDGTAAVKFPTGLPGSATGELCVTAEILAPPQFAGSTGQAAVLGASAPPATPEVPRALWSSRVPLPLLLTIIVLITGVWITYAYAVVQLLSLRKRPSLSNKEALS